MLLMYMSQEVFVMEYIFLSFFLSLAPIFFGIQMVLN